MDRKLLCALLLGAATITGCTDGTQGVSIGSRKSLASDAAMSDARQGAEICARHAPDGRKAIASLKSVGFKKSPRFSKERNAAGPPPSGQKSLEYLEKRDHGVVVYVYSHIPARSDRVFLDNFFCSVAVQNMSQEQAYRLSKVWIDKFNATEEKLFRGVHVEDQTLELQAVTRRSKIQIHILRSTSHVAGRGAAIVLQHLEKGSR